MAQRIIQIEAAADATPCACGACDWRGEAQRLSPCTDAILTPGDACPAGRCPECDSLAYLDRVKDRAADRAGAVGRIIAEMLAYERRAFEGDEPVNGADLVDAFAGWRARISQALDGPANLADSSTVEAAAVAALFWLRSEMRSPGIAGPVDIISTLESALSGVTVEAPGAKRVVGDLLGALDACETQIDQMSGLFDDDDGAIAAALEAADDAAAAARDWLAGVDPLAA